MQATTVSLSSAVAMTMAIAGVYLANATVRAAPTFANNLSLLAHPASLKNRHALEATWSITYRRVQACGKTLADLLQNICHEGYNVSDDDINNNADTAVAAYSSDDDATTKSTITRECCQQPCDFRELLHYCQNATSANDRLSRQMATDAKSLELLYIYTVRTGTDSEHNRNRNTSATEQLNLKTMNRYDVYKTSDADDEWHSYSQSQSQSQINTLKRTTAASLDASTAVTYNEWNVQKKKDPYLKRNTPVVFRSATG